MFAIARSLCSVSFAFAAVACGGAPERPEAPSPPPLTTEAPQAEVRPEPAVSQTSAREPAAPAPVPPPEEPPASVVEPQPEAGVEDPPADPAATDPLQWMEDRQAREEAERVRIAAAEKAVADARAHVAELEKRLLAVRNPFLPRPVLPPEEAAAWEGLDGAERAKRVEAQLGEARSELERAEKTLADLRGR